MRVAMVVPYASFVEVNMCKAFELMGIDTFLFKTGKCRFDYRGSPVKYETFPKTIELPCTFDNRNWGQFFPFPIIPNIKQEIKNLDVDIISVSEHNSGQLGNFHLIKRDGELF